MNNNSQQENPRIDINIKKKNDEVGKLLQGCVGWYIH